MEYIKKTGKHKHREFKKNQLSIIDFFIKNPEATQKDCADYLKISAQTVHNHLKKLRENI
jgi:DNA-binding MarR family transcriptional regulator